MSDSPNNDGASPEPTDPRWLEELYDEFESALRAGRSPKPQDYVERVPAPDRPGVLRELEALVNDYRARTEAATAPLVEGHLLSTVTYKPETTGTPELPERIGRYKIVGWLGAGAMGVVYRAHHPVLNQEVALKTIPPQDDEPDPGETARILAEAQHVAKLKHPNVVAIHDADAEEGRPYFTMALVEGKTLQSRIVEFEFGTRVENDSGKTESLTARGWNRKQLHARKEKTLALMEKVCRAIHAAHTNVPAIIHRDLKPGNILLDGDEPRVSDFGLARSITAEDECGISVRIYCGTPSYMSPEQHRGDARNILATSDVWAIGVILFRLFTGRHPFQGDTDAEVKLAVLNNEPPRPRQLNPRIDLDLEAIILKCLDKDVIRRYQTALDVADDLARCRTGVPIPIRPIGRLERGRRWAKRKPALAGLLGLATLTVVVTIVLLLINWSLEADRSRKAQIKAANDALDKGTELSKQGDAAQGLLWMARGVEMAPADDEELHNRIREKLSESCRQISPLKAIFNEGSRVLAVAFSPDGRTFLTGNANGIARLRDTVTGRAVREFRHPAQVLSVAFSPDGKTILTGCFDGIVRLWNRSSTEGVPQFERKHGAVVHAVAFSPYGGTFFSGGSDGTVRAWGALSGKPLGTLDRHEDLVLSLAISSDGETIVTGTGDAPGTFGKARRWKRSTLQPDGDPLPHLRPVWAVAFSPDDKSLVTGTENEALYWDLERPKAPRRFRLAHAGVVRSVAFSHDGKTILTGSNDTTAQRWDASSGKRLGSPLHHGGTVRSAVFSPDPNNMQILTGSEVDGCSRIWEVPAALEIPQTKITLWTQVLTGIELDDKGRIRPLTAEDWHERRERLGELGGTHIR